MKKRGLQAPEKEHFIDRLYTPFGKFIIQHEKLDNNVLLLKYPNSYGPTKIKRQIITDDIRNLLVNLLDTGKIDIDLQKRLDKDEKELFKRLITLSGLSKFLNYQDIKPNLKDYIDRIKIIQSSFAVGNNTTDNNEEIKELLQKLYELNNITLEERNELLECFN